MADVGLDLRPLPHVLELQDGFVTLYFKQSREGFNARVLVDFLTPEDDGSEEARGMEAAGAIVLDVHDGFAHKDILIDEGEGLCPADLVGGEVSDRLHPVAGQDAGDEILGTDEREGERARQEPQE